MKQIVQNLRSGETLLEEVPAPLVRAGHLLIRTTRTVISAGTERMLVEFGKAGLIAKARSQPEKVRQVLDKIRTDGLLPTLEAVFARLDEPLPLGYCNAGVVLETGEGVSDFAPGDRVISNGPHAEIVCAPVNLCARIPDGVSDDHAAFTVLGAVALQGIRLIDPDLGERIAVIGLGLIGLMAVQLLRAHGCHVLAVDPDARKRELAAQFGAVTVDPSGGADPVAAASAFSQGRGIDGVLITASSKSNDIVHQAAQMSRKRGRIVLVGVVGLELRRSDFYEKELTFQVSCSYGPGRYDSAYEQQGRDYPFPYVRWTEQRNFQAVLEMMASGGLEVEKLIERRTPLTDAPGLYSTLADDRQALGLLLTYPDNGAVSLERTVPVPRASALVAGGPSVPAGTAVIGVIGSGNYARLVLMPALSRTPARLRTVASQGGVSAAHAARKFGFEQVTTDYQTILADGQINTVVITTRHDTHARMAIEALQAGKHVFVEKPLCLNGEELARVAAAFRAAGGPQLTVGFNRRFSPHARKMAELLAGRTEPACLVITVNAGHIPPDHWTQDPRAGGGRIIGEACHWIDLMAFLIGAPVTAVQSTTVEKWPAGPVEDKMSLTLSFADGSIGTILYLANGDKGFPKERLEVFWERKVLQLDNFRRLYGYGVRGFRKFKTRRIDKGHDAEAAAWVDRVAAGGPPLIPFDQLANVTLASFAAVSSAREGRRIRLSEYNDSVGITEGRTG